ncbi:membrane protein [Pedobacter terrae]|uniref:Membrane protein n=1 Tax=Pedobacter terrae TaxID=405671 RepID=A0A1G8AC95_9SPHI|nr:YihY/virulence factor BrkB family protein [Pedobacter terrae]SDH18572.1 membrane protein [Pedobacter terrae]
MDKITAKNIWGLLRQIGTDVIAQKVLKVSASLAFYTIFSIGPMLMVIIFLSSFFLKEQAVEGIIYEQIKSLVGNKAALQIQEIIKNASITGDNMVAATTGFIALIIGATTVFAEIQDTINSIWNLEVRVKRGWLNFLKNRLLSFSLVVSLAFLLLVSLIVNGVIEGFMNKLQELFPNVGIILIYIVNLVITLFITSSLFAIIFKVLPDALIRWRDVAVGAILTALLFMTGKFGISFYISKSHPGSAYGTAGSIIILMLWIYFSAIILYIGAVFTKCYATKFGKKIKPKNYAVVVHSTIKEDPEQNLSANKPSSL